MKHYLIAETTTEDRTWVPEYLENVTPLVHECNGKFLARTSKLEQPEGEGKAPAVITLIEFPSRSVL